MKYSIYIMRHQRPGSFRTNCVDSSEVQRVHELAECVRSLDVHHVFSCTPGTSKHVRPIQTASNLCSILGKSLELCDGVGALPNYILGNTLIVWHHSDTSAILSHFGIQSRFEWPDDEYDGCLIINDQGWGYEPHFFTTNTSTDCGCCWSLWSI
jgi:hypothetical protein